MTTNLIATTYSASEDPSDKQVGFWRALAAETLGGADNAEKTETLLRERGAWSKASVSKGITIMLKARDEQRAAQPVVVEDEPTEKQIAFFRSLNVQLGADADAIAAIEAGLKSSGLWNRKAMSDYIDRLVAERKLQEAKRSEAKPSARAADDSSLEGFHEVDGVVYKVQRAVHGSGHLYAKQLDPNSGSFDYVGRAPLAKLSERTVLTLERAKELGHLYGVCVRCGRTLTDENSIAAGIGPICAGKF